MEFWILVTRNLSNKVVSIYSPDFDQELINEQNEFEIVESDQYRVYATLKLKENIKKKGSDQINPKTHRELAEFSMDAMQHWEYIQIENNLTSGCFATIIPFTGQGTMVISVLVNVVITFLSMRVTSSSDDADKNPDVSYAISIFSAIFNAVIGITLFFKTDTKFLKDAGHSIDRFFPKIWKSDRDDNIKDSNQNIKYRCLSIFAVSCVMINTTISTAMYRQSFLLLMDKFLKLESGVNNLGKDFLWTIGYIGMATSTYGTLVFQISFVTSAVSEHFKNAKPVQPQPIIHANSLFFRFNRPNIRIRNDESEPLLEQSTPQNRLLS